MDGFFHSGMHWKFLNFFIFVAILFYFLRKPLADFWKNRAKTIGADIEEAGRLRREAASKVLELEKRVKQLSYEGDKIISDLRATGEAEKKKIIQGAEMHAKKLKQDAERIMAQEIQKTKVRLKRQLVEVSYSSAQKMIQEKISTADQERLSESFLKGLEERV